MVTPVGGVGIPTATTPGYTGGPVSTDGAGRSETQLERAQAKPRHIEAHAAQEFNRARKTATRERDAVQQHLDAHTAFEEAAKTLKLDLGSNAHPIINAEAGTEFKLPDGVDAAAVAKHFENVDGITAETGAEGHVKLAVDTEALKVDLDNLAGKHTDRREALEAELETAKLQLAVIDNAEGKGGGKTVVEKSVHELGKKTYNNEEFDFSGLNDKAYEKSVPKDKADKIEKELKEAGIPFTRENDGEDKVKFKFEKGAKAKTESDKEEKGTWKDWRTYASIGGVVGLILGWLGLSKAGNAQKQVAQTQQATQGAFSQLAQVLAPLAQQQQDISDTSDTLGQVAQIQSSNTNRLIALVGRAFGSSATPKVLASSADGFHSAPVEFHADGTTSDPQQLLAQAEEQARQIDTLENSATTGGGIVAANYGGAPQTPGVNRYDDGSLVVNGPDVSYTGGTSGRPRGGNRAHGRVYVTGNNSVADTSDNT